MRTTTTLMAIVYLAGATSVFAQQPITKTMKSSTSTATIQAIDSSARTVVLRDESGDEDTYSIGPQMTRFDELKVGERVKTTYYESVVLQIRKPGQPDATSVDFARTAGTGALPRERWRCRTR